jgi:NADH dehydrogenase/NADH:ubiquinone oxidoreductase subunit G
MGALTSKPYAFIARSWELTPIDTIDIMDAVGSQLMFFVRDENVIRVLPRVFNFFTSVEWITDKARFFYDALRRGRITYPFFKFRGVFVRICLNFVYCYMYKMSSVSQKKASLTFGCLRL